MKYFYTLVIVCAFSSFFISSQVHAQVGVPDQKQTDNSIQGHIYDLHTGKEIPNAQIYIQELAMELYSDSQGAFTITRTPSRKLSLIVSHPEYLIQETIFTPQMKTLEIGLKANRLELNEVLIIGRQGKTQDATSTVINRMAIEHLQATSLEEVLQLVPGSLVRNPDFSNAGEAGIRQIGNDKLSSLGTSVMINGARISNNANLQAVNTSIGGTGASFSSTAGAGVDLRSINADNIEYVEVIRGIPSVEYGDLNGGIIRVETKASKEPLHLKARFNPTVTQFWGGKGFEVGVGGALYADLDYTKSNDTETNLYQNYQRITSMLQYSRTFGQQHTWRTNTSLGFTYSHDLYDMDPDFVVDSMKNEAKERHFRFSTNGVIDIDRRFSKTLKYTISGNYGLQSGYQQRYYNADITAESYAMESGTHEVAYLPSAYLSRMQVDGKPFSLSARISNQFYLISGTDNHSILTGMEWSMDANYGEGKTFSRPPRTTGNAAYRVRAFHSIPALIQLGVYVQDYMSKQLGGSTLNLSAGLRFDAIQPFQDNYKLHVWSPRLNLSLKTPLGLVFRAGYGTNAKAPTLLYLYPEQAYFDFFSLNYYASDPRERMAMISTRVYDTENHQLKLSKTNKAEFGIDFQWGTGAQQKRLGITAFHEQTQNGYSMATTMQSVARAEYPLYTVASQPEGAPPILSDQVTQQARFISYLAPGNTIDRVNKGVEFELDLGRFETINTQINLNGAYMSTRSVSNAPYILQQNVAGRETTRVGVFATGRGQSDERLVSTLRAMHHIPKLRFIITLSAQTIWVDQNRYLNYQSIPIGYIPLEHAWESPEVRYFTEAERADINNITDPDLYLSINDAYHLSEKWDPIWLFNLKLTKEFASGLNFSFYANNVINHRPLQNSTRYPNRYTKRNVPFFFGSEIAIKF